MTRRVAFDVTPELVGVTGVARYSRALREALAQRGDWEVVPFAVSRGAVQAERGIRRLPVPLRLLHPLWRAVGRPRAEDLTGPVDVVHSIDLIAPPTRAALVVTVHDLAALELPHLHGRRTVAVQRRRISALDRADAILAVSHSTAASLLAGGMPADRIHVSPLGLVPLAEPTQPPATVAAEPYVLTVGTLEPRKGHELVLRAAGRSSLADIRLVFAGPDGGSEARLRVIADELALTDRLTILGAVDDGTLSALYRRAAVVCMPSLAEGFGLPVLEAMSAAAPVIASDLPVVREVTAGSAVLFTSGDVEALRAALERVLGDPDLRRRLAADGPTTAARYTWERTAAVTVEAYEAALGRQRP